MAKYNYYINPHYAALTDFVHRIPQCFDTSGELIYDARNKVRLFNVDGVTLVVKRFKRPLFHQRIDYTFIRPSKAKRAYQYALKLNEMDVDTPDAVACIEEKRGGLFYYGYFISTFCGDPDCRILREEPSEHDDLVHSLALFLVKMHEKGFLHGDTNLSNFLYRKDDREEGGYHITTIDINRSQFMQSPTKEQCLKSLMRMTHVREACTKIVSEYARIRGWNADDCCDVVISELTKFEKKKERLRKLKNKK